MGGPIHAGLTRNLTTLMARGQWRLAITDAHGQLLHAGITWARPTGWARRWAGSREIVELQIPAAALAELLSDPDAVGAWRPVITDLAQQYASGPHPPKSDPTRRAPDALLLRHLQIRDRRCIMIGCRCPARGADADHTTDHARGGAAIEHNLGQACRHDHRLKHDGGWQLEQFEPATSDGRSGLAGLRRRGGRSSSVIFRRTANEHSGDRSRLPTASRSSCPMGIRMRVGPRTYGGSSAGSRFVDLSGRATTRMRVTRIR
jgi:hypothetical protein